jgi:hypothetical protein
MERKAQIQLQFNWIYIAVVGAIILAVFVSIALGVKKTENTKLSIDAINYFDGIFTSVQASENTENAITLPGLELEIATDRDNCNSYTIKGSDLGGRSTEYVPLFSPDIIKRNILSYSIGWNIPFRVNYFLYLTSPEIAYVSVGRNDIFSKMPEHLTSEQVDDVIDFENENYYKVRFFSSDVDPEDFNLHNSLDKVSDKDISAVYYNGGNLKFYSYSEGDFELEGESYYVDDATLIAALYSENLGTYECNMQKAFIRMNKFTEILKGRVGAIRRSKLMPLCSPDYYVDGEKLLGDLIDLTASPEITQDKLAKAKEIKSQLESLNTEINKKSCPTIY